MQTISENYRDMNRQLHRDKPDYGANGHRYAGMVLEFARVNEAKTILDYGCGKGTLGIALRANDYDVREYDPAIEGKDAPPEPADLVYCGDVAEHIEPEFLVAFLNDLKRVTGKSLILIVATRPAKKFLADGRNAHLIQKPVEWWLPMLTERFDLQYLHANPLEFTFIGVAK